MTGRGSPALGLKSYSEFLAAWFPHMRTVTPDSSNPGMDIPAGHALLGASDEPTWPLSPLTHQSDLSFLISARSIPALHFHSCLGLAYAVLPVSYPFFPCHSCAWAHLLHEASSPR